METLILGSLGLLALIIVFLRSRRAIKGFAKNYAGNNCAACGSCCSADCEHKRD